MTNPTEGNKGRVIKFRAWDGERMDNDPWFDEYRGGGAPVNAFAYDNRTFMQFTGLTDKNGKEIYEGDIVEAAFPHDGAYEIRIAPIGGVELWRGGSPLGAYNDASDPLNLDWRNLKVIGNIYENEDLLK